MTTSMQQSQYNPDKTFAQEQLELLDPMLEGGMFKVEFNKICPLEIREFDSEGKEIGSRDMLGIRIMANPSRENYQEVKIQITSQDNLFMIYECRVNERKFQKIKKTQSLNFNFNSFMPMLVKLLSFCGKYPEQYSSILVIRKGYSHNFSIIQNIQYKNIQLLSLQFEPIQTELKKQCLSFRFSMMKARNQKIQQKTAQMLSIVKLKNLNMYQFLTEKKNNTSNSVSNISYMNLNKSTYR